MLLKCTEEHCGTSTLASGSPESLAWQRKSLNIVLTRTNYLILFIVLKKSAISFLKGGPLKTSGITKKHYCWRLTVSILVGAAMTLQAKWLTIHNDFVGLSLPATRPKTLGIRNAIMFSPLKERKIPYKCIAGTAGKNPIHCDKANTRGFPLPSVPRTR